MNEKRLFTSDRFHVVDVDFTTAAGPQRRSVIRHPGAAAILPVFEDGRICLIRNYRPAAGKTLIEIPAGTLEPPEPPEVTAARELTEETGYRADKLELITEFYVSPGILDERMYLYEATGLHEGNAALEDNEQIENLIVTFEQAMTMLDEGAMEDAKTIAALLLYERRNRK